MQSEVIKLSNEKIVGAWHHHGFTKQLVVICHGFQSSSSNPIIIAITEGLNNGGHDTFTFNFSKNTGGFDIEHQVKDIARVIKRFEAYDEIILIGHSFAALTTAIATIQLARVKGLVTLNGFFGSRHLGHENRKNFIKFRMAAWVVPKYRKILQYYKRELQPSRITIPVLTIHSKVDEYVLIQQSQKFFAQVSAPKHFVLLETADHGITSPDDEKGVVNEINKWLKLTATSS